MPSEIRQGIPLAMCFVPQGQEGIGKHLGKGSQQVVAGLWIPDIYGATPVLVLVAAILGSQHGLFHAPPGLSQAVTKPRSLCNSYQGVPRQ